MKEISLEEIKAIQVDILQAIHDFCKENNIKYSLGCGTLLGSVRHKGYIPWDDDIDLYFMRKDYENLIKKFPVVYKNYIELICLERDKEWGRPYAKAFNNKTLLIENTTEKKRIGVGIDIYAIDYVPDKEEVWSSYNNKRLFFQNILTLKSMIISKDRSLIKNMIIVLSHILLLPFNQRRIAMFINEFAQKNNGRFHTYVCECVQGVITGKKRFLAADFDEVVDSMFEGRTFKIMKGYDDYLTNAYGDYMTPPPPEKRISTHETNAYWMTDKISGLQDTNTIVDYSKN